MKVYEVGSEIATVLKDMNRWQSKWLMRMIAIPTKTLRAGATLDPAFIIKNFFRDTGFAAVFSLNRFVSNSRYCKWFIYYF